MNKEDYLMKVEDILNDSSKFKSIKDGALAHELPRGMPSPQAQVHSGPQPPRCCFTFLTQRRWLDKVMKRTCRTLLEPPHTTYDKTITNRLNTLMLK